MPIPMRASQTYAHHRALGDRPCRKCGRLFSGERCQTCDRAWHEANKERINAGRRKLRAGLSAEERRRRNASSAAWHRAHPGQRLPRLYGISLEKAIALRETQRNLCAVCLGPMSDDRRSALGWVIDHFVAPDGTPVVRGILHSTCNRGLGLLNDHDPVALRRAADYLEVHHADL
jgi:hypothetical protein